MSINTMVNTAVARRPDMVPLGVVPRTIGEIAMAASTPPSTGLQSIGPSGGALVAPRSDTAMNVLFGYIPTEVLTLYVAALAAIQHDGGVTSSDWLVFLIALFATPLTVWVLFAVKLKGLRQALPLRFGTWPAWEMFAATLAYMTWAFALPHSPFSEYGWYSSAVSSLAMLLVSTFLGLIAPLFQKELST